MENITEALKKLCDLRESVDFLVKENFGYCPSGDKNFDALLNALHEQEDVVRHLSDGHYQMYADKYY